MRRTLFLLVVLALPGIALSGEGIEVLTDGGFESDVPIGIGSPLYPGYWSGDISQKVGAMDGIVPLEGSQMLKFIHAASYIATDEDHSWAQVHHIVDLSPYKGIISAGGTKVQASAHFNRVQLDQQTDKAFSISIGAYEGDPTDYHYEYPGQPKPTSLGGRSKDIWTDSDLNTWELAAVEMDLPVNTDFVVISINAIENVFSDPGDQQEFDGHYADGVSLLFVPEPATMMLFGIGFALQLMRRRR